MDPRNKGPVTYLDGASLKNALTRQPVNENLLQLNEFRFVLHRIPNTVYLCQGVTLPGTTIGVTVQPSPYPIGIRRPGTTMSQEDLVIRFIVNENMTNWMEIRNWMKSLTGQRDFSENSWEANKYSDATLILMNSKSIPFIKITFQSCWPRQIGNIEFATTVTDITPAVCDVSFAYTGYDVEYLNAE
jgi:hypothetical protein